MNIIVIVFILHVKTPLSMSLIPPNIWLLREYRPVRLIWQPQLGQDALMAPRHKANHASRITLTQILMLKNYPRIGVALDWFFFAQKDSQVRLFSILTLKK